MNRKVNQSAGFTLVELMMAMAFLAVLLVIITLTVIQISNIYNKGLTMRAVDSAGVAISGDIRQTLSQSQPFDTKTALCLQNNNGGCTTNVGDAVAGRLCTGVFSYVWNFGKQLGNPVNIYGSSDDQIRFIRVRDNGGQYCSDPGRKIDNSSSADPREFLNGENANLALQSFTITSIAQDATIGQALYRITFAISTNDQSSLQQDQHIDAIDTSCRPPSDSSALVDYCAVNNFDFTAEAGNKGGQS